MSRRPARGGFQHCAPDAGSSLVAFGVGTLGLAAIMAAQHGRDENNCGDRQESAEFSLDHLSTLWGKRIVGVLGGGERSVELIGGLIDLYALGRFPLDRLITYFNLDEGRGCIGALVRRIRHQASSANARLTQVGLPSLPDEISPACSCVGIARAAATSMGRRV
jgi:hypothetical protein